MPPDYAGISDREKKDIRRIRGELSCNECRRLKLKCDKKIPCASCVRRGCDSVCPTGTLMNGTGKRPVLSDTGSLHSRIDEMGQRIAALEESIHDFQSKMSTDTHPLLRPELLSIKYPLGMQLSPTERSEPPTLELADALGTLTINENGSTQYLGSTAGTESLLLSSAGIETTGSVPIFRGVAQLRASFPLLPKSSNWDVPKCLIILYSYLPPKSRAWAICDAYYNHAPWIGRTMVQDEAIEEFLVPAYNYIEQYGYNSDVDTPLPHTKLASLFFLLAMGTLLDLSIQPYSPEADIYFDLGCATLNVRPLFSSPDIGTIQALILAGHFLVQGSKRFSMEGCWSLISVACKLAQSIGLYRENSSNLWKFEPKVLNKRRQLLWDLFDIDISLSIKLGRPANFRPSDIDVPFPVDDDQTLDSDGNIIPGARYLVVTFARDLLSKVGEVSLNAKPQPYSVVLDLDRQFREAKALKKYSDGAAYENSPIPSKFMQPFILKQHRVLVGIYIHRNYFAEAVLGHPEDPLLSPYAASYLAAYRCASHIISFTVKYSAKLPRLFERWWGVWTSMFTASLVVGTVAVHSRDSHLAARAFAELCVAVELFEKCAQNSPRAQHGLTILKRLRDKAAGVFAGQDVDVVANYSVRPRIDTSDFDEELQVFGGHTRLLVSDVLSKRRTAQDTPTPLAEAKMPACTPDSNQSLMDFFYAQSGDGWIPPVDGVLPIPQPVSSGIPDLTVDSPFFLSEFPKGPGIDASLVDADTFMLPTDESTDDYFLRLLDESSSMYGADNFQFSSMSNAWYNPRDGLP